MNEAKSAKNIVEFAGRLCYLSSMDFRTDLGICVCRHSAKRAQITRNNKQLTKL